MNPESQIEKLVQDFVANVTKLARETAMSTLTTSLARGGEVVPRRTAAATAKAPTPSPTQSPTPVSTRRPKKGAKRPAADIAQLEAVLAKHIAAHPGQRVEQINKILGTKTNDVRLPLAKLLAAGTIKSKGKRRATRYFPA